MTDDVIYKNVETSTYICIRVEPKHLRRMIFSRFNHLFVRSGDYSFKHLTATVGPDQLHQWQWKAMESEFAKAGWQVTYTEPVLGEKGVWSPASFEITGEQDRFRFMLKYGPYVPPETRVAPWI